MSLLDAFLLEPHPFEVWIARRTDGIKGTGTASDPYDGSTAARLDGILTNNVPVGAHVHLGPGPFDTAGYADGVSGGWQAKAGMKLEGGGIGVTTLRLINANSTDKHYHAVSHALNTGGNPFQPNRVDNFTICDLTIDCSLGANGNGNVACGGVRVMGHHCRIERVKVINWGTKSVSKPCYVLAVLTADPASGVSEIVDPGIADCIVVQPGASISGGKVTLLHAGGLEAAPTVSEGYGLGPFIRNCFADATPAGGSVDLAYEFRGLSMGWCRGGIVEGNQIHNMKVGGPYQNTTSTYDIVVRNNTYRNVKYGPFWDLGTVYPTSPHTLTSLDRDLTFDSTGKTAVATVSSNPTVSHGFQPGERARIDTATSPNAYEGRFVILDVPAPNQFRYVMSSDPGAAAVGPVTYQKVFGAGRLVVEGNLIMLATTGSFGIHIYDQKIAEDVPTDIYGDVIVRNNKVRYVDGQFETTYLGSGVELNGAANAIVTDNVIETAEANSVQIFRCRNVGCQNNRKPSGVLIQGYNPDSGKRYDELETDAEDALVLALFNER